MLLDSEISYLKDLGCWMLFDFLFMRILGSCDMCGGILFLNSKNGGNLDGLSVNSVCF